MADRYCTECGRALGPEDKFCPGCGATIKEWDDYAPQTVQQEKKAQENRANAEKMAEDLKSKKVVIKAKAGEGGKLFGAITGKDVADAIKAQLGLDFDKKKIDLGNPIKTLGTYSVDIKLYPEVKSSLSVEVEAE